MEEDMSTPSSLIETMLKVGPDDLARVDAEIARLEDELRRLRLVRSLIAPRTPNPIAIQQRTSFAGELREKAVRYIASHGPERAVTIARSLGLSRSNADAALRLSTWFTRLPDGRFDLTTEGHEAAKQLSAPLEDNP